MCGTVSAAKPIKTTRIILVLKSPLSKAYKAITPKAQLDSVRIEAWVIIVLGLVSTFNSFHIFRTCLAVCTKQK